jgi:DnaK suppressor protein
VSDPTLDLDALGVALAGKRTELEAELARLSAPPDDQGGISFGKRVGDGTSMAVERITQVAAHERLQETLAEVVRAEAKMSDGSYGRCDVCGRPIAAGRLEALPWATRCVEDAVRR